MAESIKRGSAPPPLQSPAVPVSVPPSSGGAAKVVNEKMEKQTKDMLRNEGIISNTEEFETLYLAEDEIEKFMEKYLRENPGTEVETRYVNHPPIEMTQNIEVRWLRPETPEIPPIIIREVEQPAEPQKPPLRIVEKRKPNSEPEAPKEPLIIREKPPMVAISEPKYAYVQNVIKKEAANPTSSKQQPLKLDASRSTGPITVDSQSTYTNFNNRSSRLEFEGQRSERDMNYSYEEHASVIDYDEEEIDLVYGRSRAHARHHLIEDEDLLEEEKYRIKQQQQQQQQQSHQRSYEDEHQLRLYEEKLKKTLYEEYLLRLERERLEKKLSKSGLLEERIRERSISQDRLSHLRDGALREHNKYRTFRERERLIAAARERERDLNEMMMMRHHIIRERQTQSFDLSNSDTSSYKNIKFAKVTDEHDLNRLNDILNNPNSQILCSKADADKIASSLADIDTIIDTSFVNQESIIIDNNNNNNHHHNNPNNNHNFNSNSATNHTHIHGHLNNHNNCNNNNNSHLNNHNNSNNNRTRHNNHKEHQNSNNINNNNYNIHHHHQYHAPIIRNSHKYTDGIANINELASDRRTTRIIQGSSANNFIKNYSDRSSSDLENSHTAIEVDYSIQQHQHQPQQRKTHPHPSQKQPAHQAPSAKQQHHHHQQKQHHHHHHQQVPQTHKSHTSHHYDDLYMNGSSSASPPPSSAAPTLIQDSSSSAYKSNDTASSNVTKHRVTKIHSYYHTTNYPNNENLNNIYITKY